MRQKVLKCVLGKDRCVSTAVVADKSNEDKRAIFLNVLSHCVSVFKFLFLKPLLFV